MGIEKRIGLAVGIVVFDFVTIAVPFAALLLAYVLVQKPEWFKKFVDELYNG